MLRRTWKFFVLTFVISWLLWLPGVLRSNGYGSLPEIPGMFAVFGPAIAAFILVSQESGRAGMGRLLRRAFATGFKKRWWLPTLLLFPAIGILTAVILLLLGEPTPDWIAPTLFTALVTFVTILFIGGGLEEFGWRGYALDRMQTGQNAVTASLVLGLFRGWRTLNRGQTVPQPSLSSLSGNSSTWKMTFTISNYLLAARLIQVS